MGQAYSHGLTVRSFIEHLGPQLVRVTGTAVYLTGNLDVVPIAFLHNLKHNKVLHERVVMLTVRTDDVLYVGEASASRWKLGKGFYQVTVDLWSWISRTFRTR